MHSITKDEWDRLHARFAHVLKVTTFGPETTYRPYLYNGELVFCVCNIQKHGNDPELIRIVPMLMVVPESANPETMVPVAIDNDLTDDDYLGAMRAVMRFGKTDFDPIN